MHVKAKAYVGIMFGPAYFFHFGLYPLDGEVHCKNNVED